MPQLSSDSPEMHSIQPTDYNKNKKYRLKKSPKQLKLVLLSIWNWVLQVLGIFLKSFKAKSDRKSNKISFYNGQQSCSRTISILKSVLHFLKAKDIKNCLKQHKKQVIKGKREKNFKFQRNFISPELLSAHVNFKICVWHLVLWEHGFLLKWWNN